MSGACTEFTSGASESCKASIYLHLLEDDDDVYLQEATSIYTAEVAKA